MRSGVIEIVPLSRRHIAACEMIVAASDPWKRLGERVDFERVLAGGEKSPRPYVCVINGIVAGFVIFTPEQVFARGGYLRAIGVAPGIRRRGVGGLLLSFAEREIAKHAPNVYLCASSFNRGAQRFYKSRGYVRVGTLKDLIVKGQSEYIYRKRLAPVRGKARDIR